MRLRLTRAGRRIAAFVPILSALTSADAPAQAQLRSADATPGPQAVAGSGLPVPRFVSLKADRVHSRQGPGTDHKVLWVYRRAGLPVEVIREFEGWRQVRDSEGAEGWVLQALVSGRRTALVTPWEMKSGNAPKIELLSDDKLGSATVARLEAGVIANIKSCDTRWCYVSIGDYRGYIEQKQLWGVYPGETVR
jgi:SH3-like domain-containing protein